MRFINNLGRLPLVSGVFVVFILCSEMLVTDVDFVPKVVKLKDILNRIAKVPTEKSRCVTDTYTIKHSWCFVTP